ncbi:uncharacterized protein OCT59_007023 [Rhizophagus irregularis]|uniref:Uncharacterized protein n=1 Tax=Rhizophagus irregularis TaxID=588596 RepID=A0A915ZDU1_9GLOM|nr:hypothetical protein OCT59_007023 [Rhizophagus irregularis]GBC32680.2 hypothetical protein RIR_jg12072.t1 [Rhizophagus irregularis DAOM 181602=DAOM 197198]CAB4488054.1 unnamed protein product [Rhizophagus irregularis]CAB5370971.1 unnamed protein product [Rhizophagus irregularis]CAG8727475.1 2696_t:CDS:2 [Rhizophagus irregularis]
MKYNQLTCFTWHEEDEVKLPPPSKCRDSPISSDEEEEDNEEALHSNGYYISVTTMTVVDKNVKNIKLLDDREF